MRGCGGDDRDVGGMLLENAAKLLQGSRHADRQGHRIGFRDTDWPSSICAADLHAAAARQGGVEHAGGRLEGLPTATP
jgi:hypothetical protein